MHGRWLAWSFGVTVSFLSVGLAGCFSSGADLPGATPSAANGSSAHPSSSAAAASSSKSASTTSNAGGGKSSSSSPASPAPAGSKSGLLGPYTTSGNQILDKNANEHFFRGVDRPSMEWSCSGDIQAIDYQAMAQWGANVVRLSLNQDCWLNDPSNPSYDSTYADNVDTQVQEAQQNGLDIILDLHWSDKGDYSVGHTCLTTQGGNCQQDMADAHSKQFWQEVAMKYANAPNVLFELYNEPRIGGYNPSPGDASWQTWLNGGTSNGFTVVGMQELYDTVRATGANNLVIVGGLDWAYDLRGVSMMPVNGTNILYATHPYQNKSPDSATAFGFLTATYPVIATEFGDTSTNQPSGCSATFDTTVLGYMDGQSGNIPHKMSWTAWAFYLASSCTFPPLLADSNYTPNAPGMVVQAALMAGP